MSIIRNSKPHEDMPDFDEMMNEVNEEIQEKDAEQDIINRVPQLKELSANIDQATNTWASATFELERAIEQYDRAERKLDSTVTDIRGKVDNINEHIDNVMKDAPDKLKVSVNVADADWQKIQDLFDQEHKWMLGKMQENIRQVNAMFVEERRYLMVKTAVVRVFPSRKGCICQMPDTNFARCSTTWPIFNPL